MYCQTGAEGGINNKRGGETEKTREMESIKMTKNLSIFAKELTQYNRLLAETL